jgi:drug/metabolite transporter (DMT)-like permease
LEIEAILMKKVVLYIFLSAGLFSTMEVVLKIAGNHLDTFQLTFIRFLIGGLFLLPFALAEIKKYHTAITKKDYLHMLAMGVVCICISMIFFQIGVENSKASTSAVIFCINPMFTMLFVHFMTEEKLNRIKVTALAIGLVGIIFMINPLQMDQGNTPLGVTLSIAAALTFGLYSAMGRTSVRRLRGLTQTSISFLLGSAVMLPILLILDKPIVAGISAQNIWMVLYISIFVTGFGYLFYFLAMEASNAATASIVFFVKPALAPIIAVIALHETIRINGYIGILLIFAGSFINLREQKLRKLCARSAETEQNHSFSEEEKEKNDERKIDVKGK